MVFTLSTINFNEPRPWSNNREMLLGLPIAFLSLAWICIVNRLYIRHFVVKSPGWDDFFVILYGLSTTVGTVSIALAVQHGFGDHFLKLKGIDEMNNFLKFFYIGTASYSSSTTFIKLALLFQYMRVFPRESKMHKVCIYLAVITGLWGFSYSAISWIPCWPVSDYWDLLSTSQCFGFGSRNPSIMVGTYASHTATNMLLDVVILALPCQLFFAGDATRAQKYRLCVLLGTGSLIIVFAGWRLHEIIKNKATTYPTFDPTWYAPISVLLAILEVDCAAICASMPIFWPQITKTWGQIMVVKEVKVTRETRQFDFEDDSALTRHYLQRVGSAGSDMMGSGDVKKTNYQDSYVLKSVDPLRGVGPQIKPSRSVKDKGSAEALRTEMRW